MKKLINRNNVILFAIAFVITLAVAVICYLSDAERITILMTAPLFGAIGVLGVGALFTMEDMKMPMGPEAGFVGVIVASLINVIVF